GRIAVRSRRDRRLEHQLADGRIALELHDRGAERIDLVLKALFGGELDFVHVNRATAAGGGGLDRAQNPELSRHDRRSALYRDGRDRSTAVGGADGVRSTERRRDVLEVLVRLEQVAEVHVVLATAIDDGRLDGLVPIRLVAVKLAGDPDQTLRERSTQRVAGIDIGLLTSGHVFGINVQLLR